MGRFILRSLSFVSNQKENSLVINESYFTAIYGYKILKLMTPEYVYNQFLNQSHRFPIRDVNILKAPNDNNFLNRISITFNNLPENIRSQTKFSSFKNLSFKHFMSHA